MSCIFGENRDIFFPKLSESLHLITFAEIAVKYLDQHGYKPYLCKDEDEARTLMASLPEQGMWPASSPRATPRVKRLRRVFHRQGSPGYSPVREPGHHQE